MKVPLFGSATRSKSANATAQRRVNLYGETPQDPDRSPFILYPTPGLTYFANLFGNPVRGMYSRGGVLYVAHQASLYSLTGTGAATSLGTFGSVAGRVCFSDNGAQLFFVDGQKAYTYTYATSTLAEVTDGDFPDGATTCAYLDGYFIVEGTATGQQQRFYVSAINDGTSWDALEFASADSNPDEIVRVYADHGELQVFGEFSMEWWRASGAVDFPFARVTSIEWGLAAKWSVAKFDSSVIFLARNRTGNIRVVQLTGYQPTTISTPDIDELINRYEVTNDATAFAYTLHGHPFYELTFPTEGVTWLYDGLTGLWSEIESSGGRHLADVAAQYSGQTYVSDYRSGLIYLLDPDALTENGTAVTRTIVTRHVFAEQFKSVAQLWIDMESGVGLPTGQGSDPLAMLRVSRDGGHSWSNVLPTSLGRQGEYQLRPIWRRLGRARDFTFEISVSDPVKTVFLGGFIEAL